MDTETKQTTNAIITGKDSVIPPAATGFGLLMSPQTIKDAREFCDMLARTDFVPKAFRGKPDSIMVCGAMGARLGIDVFSALAGIADINGRPSVYGDLMLALCMQHPAFEDCIETFSGEPYKDNFTATCVAKRKGREPVERSFSVVEAKEAGLWKKPGPWTATPQRMLQMRARSFALRDTFPDRLAGFHSREEMEDAPIDVTATATVHDEPKPAKRRSAAAVQDSPAAVEPATAAAPSEKTEPAKVEVPAAGAEPRDVSADRCVAEFSALWKASEDGKAVAKSIQAKWKLAKIADLAGSNDDDRGAFLDEVGEAMAKVKV
jgi:hypothetical protein